MLEHHGTPQISSELLVHHQTPNDTNHHSAYDRVSIFPMILYTGTKNVLDTIFVRDCKVGMAGIACITSNVDTFTKRRSIPTSKGTIEAMLHNLGHSLCRCSVEKPFCFWTIFVFYHFCCASRILLLHFLSPHSSRQICRVPSSWMSRNIGRPCSTLENFR
jgi:hypothetical protein